MDEYTQLGFDLLLPKMTLQNDDLMRLIKEIEADSEAYLTGSPRVKTEKGDPVTIASFALAVTVATLPVLTKAIFDWVKARHLPEIEIEITGNNQKVTVKFSSNQLPEIESVIKRLQSLVR